MCNETLKSFNCQHSADVVTQPCSDLNIKCDGCDQNIINAKLKCKICVEAFKTSKLLKRHLQTHADTKQPTRKFVKNGNNENRKFECQKCDWKFEKGTDLDRHMKIHSVDKFVCKICGKNFSRKDTLVNHVKKTHAPYSNTLLKMKTVDDKPRAP